MNLVSFLHELIKVGAMDRFVEKHAVHQGNSDGSITEANDVFPSEAVTRIPLTGGLKPAVRAGTLGAVTQASDPIDERDP